MNDGSRGQLKLLRMSRLRRIRLRSIQRRWIVRLENPMEFDPAKFDAPIDQENWADYWRERAECLEEWVCELLKKNQTLRMQRGSDSPEKR